MITGKYQNLISKIKTYNFSLFATSLLFSGSTLLTTGATDLDWMLVANHFDMWNAQKDTWEFCPFFTCNWWLAFELTLARIIVGSIFLGIATCLLFTHLKEKKTVDDHLKKDIKIILLIFASFVGFGVTVSLFIYFLRILGVISG